LVFPNSATGMMLQLDVGLPIALILLCTTDVLK